MVGCGVVYDGCGVVAPAYLIAWGMMITDEESPADVAGTVVEKEEVTAGRVSSMFIEELPGRLAYIDAVVVVVTTELVAPVERAVVEEQHCSGFAQHSTTVGSLRRPMGSRFI